MTPREIIAARLAELVDAARKLPRDGVIVASGDGPIGKLTWARPGRTAITDPRHWPAELPPLPFTVGDALDVVEAGAPSIVDELDGEISRMVEALVAPELRDVVDLEAVAREWPLPDDRDTARDRALDLLDGVRLPFGPRARRYFGREREIAEWAAARLEATIPEYAADLREYAPKFGGLLTEWKDKNGRWTAEGLGLLWFAERDARCRVYALDAAADVRAELARLVDARNPGPEIFAAVDAATAGEPLAAGVDDPTRGGWAGAVLALARTVARDVLALPEPTTEDDARAAAGAAAGVVADALAKLGPAGRERADTVRQRAAERAADVLAGELLAGELWALWRGTSPPRWIEALARVLWADVWRPERARQAEDTFARLVPTVATAVVSMTKAASAGDPYRDRIPLLDDKGRGLVDVLVDAHTTSLPAMTPDRLRRVFGSMTCHRWIRYALPELQALWRANRGATTLTITGGKSGIVAAMRAVGLGGSRADEDVIADVIPLVGSVVAPVGFGRKGNLYSYTIPSSPEDWRTRAGRPAQVVTITPNEPLDPRILFDTRARQAVPVDRELPPLGWVERGQHAAVATLTIMIAQNQIERRGEIAEHGGVLMTVEDWTKMINGANLRDPGGFLWNLTRDALTDGGRSDVGAAGGVPVPPFLDIVARERDGAVRVVLSAERPGIRAWLDRAVRGREADDDTKPEKPTRKPRK